MTAFQKKISRAAQNQSEERGLEATQWHSHTADKALEALHSARAGLPAKDAAERLGSCGPNKLPEPPRVGPVARFLRQFNNLLIYVLVTAAFVTGALGHLVDTSVILAVVLVNAVIGFVQEGRAEQALSAIRDMLAPEARVLRDGVRANVPAEGLVPGDIVLLEPGDRVPADLRITIAHGLRIQEAMLTGESLAVDKTADPVARETALGDRRCMAFSGALVAAGSGRGVVVATGSR
ncbi:MAG: HAD-IC family P-type ATPase, partial [Pontimonas sp.]